MTQGIFIHGGRPKTKKAFKDQVDLINDAGADPWSVVVEATSIHGNEFDGSLAKAKTENTFGPFYIVGPDPYTSRKWYATLEYVIVNGIPLNTPGHQGRWRVK